MNKPSTTEKSVQFKFSPITSKVGLEWQAAISPDGANLVYAYRKDRSEPFYLYTRHLESATARRLTSKDNQPELNPVWSPDGQKIAFLRIRNGKHYDLQIIPLAGGEEESVATLEFSTIKPNLVWSVEQARLMFSAKKTSEDPLSIFSFDFNNKEIRQLTTPQKSKYGDHFPNLLPDGRLAFIRSDFGKSLLNQKAPVNGKIILLDLKLGEEQLLKEIEHETMGMVYSKPLDKLIVWLSEHEGYKYAMRGYHLNGKSEYITSVRSHRPSNLLAYPQTPSLIYEAWSSLTDIHVFENESFEPFLQSTHWDWHPRFTSDGQKIAFLSARNGPTQIWLCDSNHPDQAAPVSVFNSRSIHWMSLSPDAEMVVLQGDVADQQGIYILETKTKKLMPLKTDKYGYAHPEFSPDGKYIYYASDKSGDWQIWRCNLKGEADEMITKTGGYKALVTGEADKQLIFYTPFKGRGLRKMEIETGHSEQLFPEREHFDKMNMAITKMGIYYYQWTKNGCQLKYYDFAKKTFQVITPLNGIVLQVPSLAVGADEKILVSRTDQIKADLLKIEIREADQYVGL